MSELFSKIFTSEFMPHGHCYLWTPDILWIHVASDALIAASYYTIPLALIALIRMRSDLAYNWMFALFAAFIFLCGTTHVFDIWTVWNGTYRLQGIVKLLTAVVSASTAVTLWFLLPKVRNLPSAEALRSEIKARQNAQEALQRSHGELEVRVEERTRELRQSLKEKEILLREIHHRVKNNMQVISSLLKLQAHQISDLNAKSMLRESEERVRAMALVHEKLYRSHTLSKVDFKAYVEELARDLFRNYAVDPKNIKLVMNIKETELNIEKAIPCGLILNELISNSFKHAFSENQSGELRIELSTKDRKTTLIVADTGKGLPPEVNLDHPSTLGLQVVTTLCQQLGAKFEVNREGGSAFSLTFEVEVDPQLYDRRQDDGTSSVGISNYGGSNGTGQNTRV